MLGKVNITYADVQVTNLTPSNDFVWERSNKNTPKYPLALARSGLSGCAILSFNISASGETENIQIINSIPKKSLGKQSRKMLKNWEWTHTSNTATSAPEKRTLRFDYCMGGESIELAEKSCKQQAKLACG
ncbi:MAG: TonB family protein [Glaciecola sp.]|nr:TonB family protein [Glaciecola sp.]MDG1816417.1 TonB family protein [Glaciecola sp.]MDG2098468.1 TonB family protein [Glaciecola sp.]